MTSGEDAWGGSASGWGQRPALLLIDLMRAYFTPGCAVRPRLRRGRDRVRAACWPPRARPACPVVHTRVRYRAGASDGGLFVRKVSALALLADDAPGDLRRVHAAGWRPAAAEVRDRQAVRLGVLRHLAGGHAHRRRASTPRSSPASPPRGASGPAPPTPCSTASGPSSSPRPAGTGRPAIHDANIADLGAKYADIATIEEVITSFGTLTATLTGGMTTSARPDDQLAALTCAPSAAPS